MKLMTTSNEESRYLYGCEIIAPIPLRVSICLQPKVFEMPLVSQNQLFEPASTSSERSLELESSTASDSHVFSIEVIELRSNDGNNKMSYLTPSNSVGNTVLGSRMNQEIRRIIHFIGSQIVAIRQWIQRC